MSDWIPDLSERDKPRYIAIADALADDILLGRLSTGDRLPPQRVLARKLRVDFTTVARGYVEAQKRGLIESVVGRGTFVRDRPRPRKSASYPPRPADWSMNLPPEPTDPDLIARMQAGVDYVNRDIVALLRYQGFGGAQADKDAASSWLGRRALVPSQERVFVTPGAHPALIGILAVIAEPGDVVLCEDITYPGIRSIAAQRGVRLVGLPMDDDGIKPQAFSDACRKLKPKGLYLNPTLQNPTTLTIPDERRREIASIARRYGVPIIEDDAYGFIPEHTQGHVPFASIAPDMTWHVAGLAKCIGAGLRAAYVVAPDTRSSWPFASALRAGTVMASPFTVALVTRWIEDGTADTILRFIRSETAARQKLATDILPAGSYRGDPLSFNIWLPLPKPWTRSVFIEHMRPMGVGVVASDAFFVGGDEAPEAVRICLCGNMDRGKVKIVLEYIAHALEESPSTASTFY
ncbi:putative HTH-type transcriptional regulator YjiR [Variibacter gotjawalensis]|uniref:Putative HTH-type transcriptional regulator YjiR n=1 Tax=Variibacter gotjawalensis TaxID=1333996 RepID=A0A0S3PUJ9_9BRAD|nr:PLP-dependent aminotransferase family protein [Variibacter gotjawalensis]NIK49897.1 DNA-binding transcriptional MocR family regulator [Variibacter gotjawalensis]RZS45896.1 GntR family transcriptional regulator [Variibacter gotjawalensis]BAT59571.1 putative HTH-type transcriptional regulator YjiR [Variibacter gotjawalensis]